MGLSIEDPLVEDFIAFLRLKNNATGTIAQYTFALRDLLRFFPPEIDSLKQLTTAHLRQYIASGQARGLKPKTVADRVDILRQFFGYLHDEGHIPTDPARRLPLPKIDRPLPKALSLAETEALLLAIREDAPLGKRDRILFELIYAGGLRPGEAVKLRVRDIDFVEGAINVMGKGNAERVVFIKKILLDALRAYIETEHLTDFVFPGYRGKPLTVRNVQLRIKDLAKAAGITRKVSPKTLRHSIAVHYLLGGAPINFIQTFLGHTELKTTGKYLLLTDPMAKQIARTTKTALDQISVAEEPPAP